MILISCSSTNVKDLLIKVTAVVIDFEFQLMYSCPIHLIDKINFLCASISCLSSENSGEKITLL